MMAFPGYVHSIVPDSNASAWPIAPQGYCECDFAATANALNLLVGEARYSKDGFIHEAGLLFQPRFGGTISPLKVWQIRHHGYGTHFGNLSRTDYEKVLCDLIDRKVPVIVELGVAFRLGAMMVYSKHSVVLVGYSDPYCASTGQVHEEYYVVDAQWPLVGPFDFHSNDADRDGDGVAEVFPGNRTLSRAEFRELFCTGLYYPIFRTQAAHDSWYHTAIHPRQRIPLIGWLNQTMVSGSYDLCRDLQRKTTLVP